MKDYPKELYLNAGFLEPQYMDQMPFRSDKKRVVNDGQSGTKVVMTHKLIKVEEFESQMVTTSKVVYEL
jgi:hypothetical protein